MAQVNINDGTPNDNAGNRKTTDITDIVDGLDYIVGPGKKGGEWGAIRISIAGGYTKWLFLDRAEKFMVDSLVNDKQ